MFGGQLVRIVKKVAIIKPPWWLGVALVAAALAALLIGGPLLSARRPEQRVVGQTEADQSMAERLPARQPEPVPPEAVQPEGEPMRTLPRDRQAGVGYVALGDSTVAGVGATSPQNTYVSRLYDRLNSAYPRARMTNLGVGGATSADVVRDQLPRALALRPHLVTLSIGPNDITQGRDVQHYEENIATIFETLSRETGAVIVANLLPDMAVAPVFNEQERAAVGTLTAMFNEVLGRQGRRYGVEIVDVYVPSRQEVPNQPSLVSEDDYHPSDAGYARWADLMWEGVAARIES